MSNELLFLITALVQTELFLEEINRKETSWELSENVMKCVPRFCGVDLLPWTRLWLPTVMRLATVRGCSSSSDSIRKRYQVTILRCSCKMALLLSSSSSSSSFVCWKTLFQCPGHIMVHDLDSFDTIVLSILWIDFPNPVSQRCPPGSPPYMNFLRMEVPGNTKENKIRSSFYWLRMQWTLKIEH